MANVQLSFTIQSQTESNWCWAAVSASISKYYDLTSTWTQCNVARRCLNKSCCTTPTMAPCNVPWFLQDALQKTGNLTSWGSGTVLFATIQSEIDSSRPIGARTEWASGNGHFVVINGYDDSSGVHFLHVQDPIYGKTYLSLSTFTNSYQSSGRWTHSFFTSQNSGGNVLTFSDIDNILLTKAKALTPKLMLSDNDYQMKKFTFSSNYSYPMGLPHDVYIISYNSLLSGGATPNLEYVGTRLIDQTPNGYLTYEFDGPGSNGSLKQVYQGQDFNERFVEAMSEAVSRYEPSANQYQVRIVRQPDLKIEVLWLYKETNSDSSIFLPIYEGATLSKGKVYNSREFFSNLINSAQNLAKPDDPTIGG